MIDGQPNRCLPGDWETLTRMLDRAYAAGRQQQFTVSCEVLKQVVAATGGSINFRPRALPGKLMQEEKPDGTWTMEYRE